jgi:hypothetical protein
MGKIMWARYFDFSIAAWLLISHSIFSYPDEITHLLANDLICALLIAAFTALSWVEKLEKIHLCSVVVAFWLVSYGYYFPEPTLQNHMVIGLTLMMTALVPTHASEPPRGWRRFFAERKR